MNTKNKELLLKDLCTRLPYGVICNSSAGNYKLLGIYGYDIYLDSPVPDDGSVYFDFMYEKVIPFLRPMSSMTEEEQNEFDYLRFRHNEEGWLDFVLSRHLDWRDLIEKGLALEAPEGMYNN